MGARISPPWHRRWVDAVNADGVHGRWVYRMVRHPVDTPAALRSAAEEPARARP